MVRKIILVELVMKILLLMGTYYIGNGLKYQNYKHNIISYI